MQLYSRRILALTTAIPHQGKLEDALPMYQRALRIDEKTYGPEHPDVAIFLNNIAMLLKAQGKLGAGHWH